MLYGRLLVGAYPSSVHDEVNARILTHILKLGTTTFVCLQQECVPRAPARWRAAACLPSAARAARCVRRYQHEGVKEYEWRSGYKLRPYIFDAIKLVDTLPAAFFPTGHKPDGLEFIHFPIQDCSIANDASVLQLCTDLVARMVRGENMYVHCLSEEHQILTSRGFMFLHELEAHEADDVLIAGYDTASGHLLYERHSALVIKPATAQSMLEFTDAYECVWDALCGSHAHPARADMCCVVACVQSTKVDAQCMRSGEQRRVRPAQ